MTDHDPMCRCTDPSWSNPAHCTCEEITNIRADERDRHAAGAWMERIWAQATEAATAQAESVAARLVEAICEQEADVRYWRRRADDLLHQRDHAQADAVAFKAELNLVRAEVAALRGQLSDTALDIAEYRRAWLARWRRCPVQNDEAQP